MEGGGEKGNKRNIKRVEMCNVHVPTHHKECYHYVLQKCTNEKEYVPLEIYPASRKIYCAKKLEVT